MKLKEIWLAILVIGISILIGVIVYNSIPKTAFVDNRRLFEAFQGKKELENKLEQDSNQKKAMIDSLGLQIKAIQESTELDENSKKRLFLLQRQYEQINYEHQGTYQQKSQEYTEAIWKQISQYTLEYSKEKGYDYVFGIAGQGSLMYGKPQYDITEEVLNYINTKYGGN